MAQQLGGSLGLAILVTIFGSATRSAAHTSPQQDLAHGVGSALTGSAVFLAAAFTVIVLLVRRRPTPPVALAEPEAAVEYATIDAAA